MRELQMFRGRVKRLVVVVAVVGLAGLGGLPAGATVIERQHFAGTDSFSYSDCGPTVNVVVEFSDMLHFRVGKGEFESAFFFHDNFSVREVHTNSDNGKWFVIRADGLLQETKAVHIGGTIFSFTAILAGQPFTIEDSSGNVVLRDRGVIRRTGLFDTEGDDVPGGIELAELDFSVAGPHPGLVADFCAIVNDLLGP